MGNRQDTFDSCADSYSIDRNGFIWAYIHSISDFDRDRNYFFYSFQSINRENGEIEDRYSPDADCRAKRTSVPYSADSLRHN